MTFSIRSLLLLAAAVAILYPILRSPSTVEFAIWLVIGCLLWGATGMSIRRKGSRETPFAMLGVVPLVIAFTDNLAIQSCDSWPDVTIQISPPGHTDVSDIKLQYVTLTRRDIIPLALKDGPKAPDVMTLPDGVQILKLRTGFFYRRSQFGNTWDHSCEIDNVVFFATHPNGQTWHGFVFLPQKYESRPFSIHWQAGNEPGSQYPANRPASEG